MMYGLSLNNESKQLADFFNRSSILRSLF